MLPIKILERTDHSILYELPPGKPDPKQPCVKGLESRDRVYQTSNKGPNCYYYALNMIRRRIGKNPAQEFHQERRIEKLCSEWRKTIQKLDDSFPISIVALSIQDVKSNFEKWDKSTVAQILKNQVFDPMWGFQHEQSGKLMMQAFTEQEEHANFYAFVLAERGKLAMGLNIDFLRKTAPEIIEQIEKGYASRRSSLVTKADLYQATTRDCLPDFYNLRFSVWQPDSGIEGLISELKASGPLVVLGKFGRDLYAEEPVKLSNPIADRDIYGWKKGAKRVDFIAGHVILLVGAKVKEGTTHVYFIDPNDPSDPADRSVQRIYAISYENLRNHICDRTGVQRSTSKIGFAIHGKFQIPKS